MGSRTAGNETAVAWAEQAGPLASEGSFADAAAFGELAFNATAGAASLEALEAAGAEQLAGKVLIDVANPLDFSQGMPPTLTVCNDDSLGERIQRAFPELRVVKALNTVTASVMVQPDLVPGGHTIFVCGDDGDAKAQARALLEEFGWAVGRNPRPRRHHGRARDGDVPGAVAAAVGRDGHRRAQRRGARRRRLNSGVWS